MRLLPLTIALATLVFSAHFASAEPTLRRKLDVVGDFTWAGNTLGHDCGSSSHVVVGTVTSCTDAWNDASPTMFWQSDATSVATNPTITPAQARSTAMLNLPASATPSHALLYWFGEVHAADPAAATTATLTGPGGASINVTADQVHQYLQNEAAAQPVNKDAVYHVSVVDVTAFVQTQGAGAYSLSNANSMTLADYLYLSETGWVLLVVYEKPGDTPHNIVIHDGVDMAYNNTISLQLSGFKVPNTVFDGKLGIVAIDGEIGGQLLRFGAAPLDASDNLSDSLNPAGNFFNGSRTWLNQAVSVTGDLSQTDGTANSMSGIDMDVVDITSHLVAGQTTADVALTAAADDGIAALIWVTSISTISCDFSGFTKTVSAPANAQAWVGQETEFTFEIPNHGNATSYHTVITDKLEDGLTFVPGSIQLQDGAAWKTYSDAAGDDQGEYDAATRTVTVRLGTSASETMGGSLAVNESARVRFRATVAAASAITRSNQAEVLASNDATGTGVQVTAKSDGDPAVVGDQPTILTVVEPPPEPQPEPQPELQPEAGPEPQPEPQPEAGPEPQPEPQPEAGPEPKPEAGPEPMAEAGVDAAKEGEASVPVDASGTDAAATAPTDGSGDDGGCSCRAASQEQSSGILVAVAGLLGVAIRRRRRACGK